MHMKWEKKWLKIERIYKSVRRGAGITERPERFSKNLTRKNNGRVYKQ